MNFFNSSRWQEIFSVIKANKLRTTLTAFSVWWGIFMLVILLGASNGLQNSVKRNFEDRAVQRFWLNTWRTSTGFKGLPKNRRIYLTNEDLEVLQKEFDEIIYSSGFNRVGGSFAITYKEKSFNFDVEGVHPDRRYIENSILTAGRFLNDRDIEAVTKVCIIGEEVRNAFFKSYENPVGKYLIINSVPFKIVGIFTDETSDGEKRTIYVPISTVQQVFNRNRNLSSITLTHSATDLEESSQLEGKIRAQLAAIHQFDRNDEQALYVYDNLKEFSEFQTVFAFIKGFIWFVGIGTLIAGVIGVSNIMLITVNERKQEFGIRKAIGATNRSIIGMVIQESIFLTSLAGVVGLLSGYALISLVDQVMENNDLDSEFFYNPEVDLRVAISAIVVLVVVGVLAGIAPARKATSINPSEALKK